MNARTYYLVRITMYSALLLVIPVFAVIGRSRLDSITITGLSILGALVAGLLAHAVWRYRNVPAAAQITYGPSPEVVRAHAAAGSRRMPLYTFGAGVLGIAVTYFGMQHGRANPIVVVGSPAMLLVGLAGTIHPPVFYAMRRDLGEQPGGARAIAYFLGIVGLGLGGFAAWWLFWR